MGFRSLVFIALYLAIFGHVKSEFALWRKAKEAYNSVANKASEIHDRVESRVIDTHHFVEGLLSDSSTEENPLYKAVMKYYDSAPIPDVSISLFNHTFSMYSLENPTQPNKVDIEAQEGVNAIRLYFNPKKFTYVIIHGFLSYESSSAIESLRREYLRNNVNVIVYSWADLTIATYGYSVRALPQAADRLARMIRLLEEQHGLDLDRLTFVGHSLGAHVAGVAGKKLGGKVGVIVGLDPAHLLDGYDSEDRRLSPTDAKYVQAIHTNAGKFGFYNPLGTVDFYVNGGMTQPGCEAFLVFSPVCSHGRVWSLFEESVNSNFGFWGRESASAENARALLEKYPPVYAKMGGLIIDRSVRGTYIVNTRDQSPFALPKSGYSYDFDESGDYSCISKAHNDLSRCVNKIPL